MLEPIIGGYGTSKFRGENFHGWLYNREICECFPPWKFSTIRYIANIKLHLYLIASRYCSLSFLMSICLVWISFISSLICLIWWFFSWIFFLKESGGSSSFRLFSKDCMIGKKSTAKLICRQRLAVTKTCLQVSPRYLWDTESLFNFQSHPYHAQHVHVPVIIHTCKLAHTLFLQALSA